MATVDVVEFLKTTRNALIGNPTNKVQLQNAEDDGQPLLSRIVEYVYPDISDLDPSFTHNNPTATQTRIEAANIIASLAHGSYDVLLALIGANAPDALLRALLTLFPQDPETLKVAILRAFRALCVASAECMGPALWGLGDDYTEYKTGIRMAIEPVFQLDSLDTFLPYLDGPSARCRLHVTELIAFAVRLPKYQAAITDWLPDKERTKEGKGKRGWENPALIDSTSPSWQGGWVLRHLIAMVIGQQLPPAREATLYALGALAKDNRSIALILSKTPDNQPVLTTVSDFARNRNPAIKLAACLCAANIISALPSGSNRRLSSTIIQILTAVISDTSEPASHRMKACHIMSTLVSDDNERCLDAWRSGTLTKIAGVITYITPTTKPQEWEDGESTDTSKLREAALTAIASISLFDNDIRNEVAGTLGLLPYITVCIEHPHAGVRYGACLCVRSLARSVRVLRTTLFDSGVGTTLCDVVAKQDEDRRVTNIALAALANLLNDFSPLRLTAMERGMVQRITELSKSPEHAIKIGAFWALRNLLNNATLSEKQDIMHNLGWDHLKENLLDSPEEVQEQALCILTNLASTSEAHIDVVLLYLPGEELMPILSNHLLSRSEDVICQACYALGNISNGRNSHREAILDCPKLLEGLVKAVVHQRFDIRRAAVACVEQLARRNPERLRQVGFVEALQRVFREAQKPVGSGAELSESRRRMGSYVGLEDPSEVLDSAQSALRLIESSGDYPIHFGV